MKFRAGENWLSVSEKEALGDFVMMGKNGIELIRLHGDGTVTGEVENASEAGRVFMSYVRANWGGR